MGGCERDTDKSLPKNRGLPLLSATMISQPFIDELICRVDLPTMIGEYVELARSGAGHEGCCPFHDEKTPSFKVFANHYHCFGCGAHGNAIRFMTEKLGHKFPEAVRLLAVREGIKMEDEKCRSSAPSPHQTLYDTLSRACAEYQRLLFERTPNPALVELEQRGIDADLAVRYGLGYAPEAWTTLSEHPTFSATTLQQTGLSVPRTGGGAYDRFRDRLMFPIPDGRGRTIGFGGRRLGSDGPKYLNSPETELYRKAAVFFGLHQATAAIRRSNHVVVAEGYFDVVTPAQHSIENVISPCGTALTTEHAELVETLADRITVCFDGDAAGNKATWAAATLLVPRVSDGHEVRLCRLPEEHDPDSLVRQQGSAALIAAFDAAPTLTDYLVGEIARGTRSAESRSRAMQAAVSQWRNFAAPALKMFFRQAVSTALGISVAEFDAIAAHSAATNCGDAMLRHCPFCGGASCFTASEQHSVTCNRCGATSAEYLSRNAAQDAWNRRERFRHANS